MASRVRPHLKLHFPHLGGWSLSSRDQRTAGVLALFLISNKPLFQNAYIWLEEMTQASLETSGASKKGSD